MLSCNSVVNLRKKQTAFFGPQGAQPRGMVGSSGLEPPTSRLSGVCSNQLSYEPVDGGGKRIRTDDPLLAGAGALPAELYPHLY